jgi:extradiol dioxygenase family protein
VDFDFFGHQLVIHQAPKMAYQAANSNPVDGHDVPVPHFGVLVGMIGTSGGAGLKAQKHCSGPIRFAGQAGEQATLFLAPATHWV